MLDHQAPVRRGDRAQGRRGHQGPRRGRGEEEPMSCHSQSDSAVQYSALLGALVVTLMRDGQFNLDHHETKRK